MSICFKKMFLLGVVLMVAACAASRDNTIEGIPTVEAPLHDAKLPDFSGHWEKNYQASDVFYNKFQLYVADLMRRFARGSSSGNREQGINVESGGGGGVNPASVNGLAQLAEEITRMPLLNIKQDGNGINVERENDFNLRCFYHDKEYVQSSNTFGNDWCGWSSQRMIFRMRMSGGLQIVHQLSLSADASQLNVTTTVASDSVATPIVISNFYTRFNSQDDHYDCRQTLTRNKVCTQQGHSK